MDGKIKVTKIGNKLGFVLPEEIAQKMKISENEEVEYKLVGRRIVLEPSDETGSLAQMFRIGYSISTLSYNFSMKLILEFIP